MTFKDGFQVDTGRATRGGGKGGFIAGGGIGGLVLAGIIFLVTGDPSALFGQVTQNPPAIESGPSNNEHCSEPGAANKYDDCRLIATAQSLDDVWSQLLPAQAGIEYRPAGLHIFEGAVSSGCGNASAKTGPFYCPADETSYFATSFFPSLRKLGGSDAPLAQEYVVAHEFGHHIQQLEGTLGLSNYNDPGQDSNAVKIELQADCYAGIWAHHADKGENAALQEITDDQVQTVIASAQAIGDDNIQERSTGKVRPDLWTHGSSQQRTDAFLRGYRSGSMGQCDTLDRGAYR